MRVLEVEQKWMSSISFVEIGKNTGETPFRDSQAEDGPGL